MHLFVHTAIFMDVVYAGMNYFNENEERTVTLKPDIAFANFLLGLWIAICAFLIHSEEPLDGEITAVVFFVFFGFFILLSAWRTFNFLMDGKTTADYGDKAEESSSSESGSGD